MYLPGRQLAERGGVGHHQSDLVRTVQNIQEEVQATKKQPEELTFVEFLAVADFSEVLVYSLESQMVEEVEIGYNVGQNAELFHGIMALVFQDYYLSC